MKEVAGYSIWWICMYNGSLSRRSVKLGRKVRNSFKAVSRIVQELIRPENGIFLFVRLVRVVKQWFTSLKNVEVHIISETSVYTQDLARLIPRPLLISDKKSYSSDIVIRMRPTRFLITCGEIDFSCDCSLTIPCWYTSTLERKKRGRTQPRTIIRLPRRN